MLCLSFLITKMGTASEAAEVCSTGGRGKGLETGVQMQLRPEAGGLPWGVRHVLNLDNSHPLFHLHQRLASSSGCTLQGAPQGGHPIRQELREGKDRKHSLLKSPAPRVKVEEGYRRRCLQVGLAW